MAQDTIGQRWADTRQLQQFCAARAVDINLVRASAGALQLRRAGTAMIGIPTPANENGSSAD
jgi:hypothetical protein